MDHAYPRLTMPSHGGLMNPRFPYSRTNRILEDFKFKREAARRGYAKKQKGREK